jgi:hypothetical protein
MLTVQFQLFYMSTVRGASVQILYNVSRHWLWCIEAIARVCAYRYSFINQIVNLSSCSCGNCIWFSRFCVHGTVALC